MGRENNIYEVGFYIKKKNGAFRNFKEFNKTRIVGILEEGGMMEPEAPGLYHDDFMQQCFEHLQMKILKGKKMFT